MGYEYKVSDVYDFLAAHSFEYRTKGDEIEVKRCPYCNGGSSDKYTFSINSKTGAFNCLRASCGKKGHFVELCRDFGYELDFGLQRQYRALTQIKPEERTIRDTAVEYMASRGISKEICRKYYITAQTNNPDVIVFPFYDENNVLQFVKYRNSKFVKGIDKNKEWCEKDCMPILFGMYQCNPENKTAVITEGQIDSLTLAECGIENALSVPTGCNGFTWVQHCIDWLESRFTKIIVFGDFERGKMTLIDEIKKRIKVADGVYRVKAKYYLGEKDANDIFRKYGRQAVIAAVENAEPATTKYSHRLAEVRNVDTAAMPKIKTMFPTIDKTIGGLFYGQVILLSGKRGEGKSTFMSQLIANALEQGVTTYVYSGELPNYMFKHWLDLQIAGKDRITVSKDRDGFEHYSLSDDTLRQINDWYYDKCFIFDNQAINDEFDGLIAEIENQILLYDVKLICIDNLMIAMDADSNSPNEFYQAQSAFVKKLAKLARKHNVVILLVAHPKKGEEFSNDMVSGSGDITNAVDVVMAYQRKNNADYNSEIIITKNRMTGICIGSNNPVKLSYGKISKRIVEYGKNVFEYSAFNKPTESEALFI